MPGINVSIISIVVILNSLLIVDTSIDLVHSSLQQEVTIQSRGSILAENSFVDKIFFEYGGETGVLQPPWDHVGPMPEAPVSYAIVDTAHARSGTRSMKLYQPSPPKSDGQRRVSNRYYQTGYKEFYVSWWVYFDNLWQTTGWGSTLGGWQIFFGPSSTPYYWWTGGRFRIHSDRHVLFNYRFGKISGGVDFSAAGNAIAQTWDTNYYITDHLNQWIHFQVYVKFRADNTGVVRAWLNNVLVAEKTGIKTDPSGYGEWNNNPVDGTQCVWRVSEYPWIVIELYQHTDSAESWIWVDDVVAATEKVPANYEVADK